MDQIELIRNEIERRMLEDYNGPDAHENEIAQGVCAGLLHFIDSLPKEPSTFDVWKGAMEKLTDKEKFAILSVTGGGFGFGGGLLPLFAMSALYPPKNPTGDNKEQTE